MRKGHDQFFVYNLLALQFLQLDDFYWLLLLLVFPQLYALPQLNYSLAYHVPYYVFSQLLPAINDYNYGNNNQSLCFSIPCTIKI